MGVSKTTHFSAVQNELATFAKALGHPARVAILEFLVQTNRCICGEIVDELPLAQPTVSQHLKELKTAGLIRGEVEGTAICYCVDQVNLERFQALLGVFSMKLAQKSACC
jgi:ArsR family transcriptional regulator, arsenate/arsenite/antimonite-responsive transcriptional repressor